MSVAPVVPEEAAHLSLLAIFHWIVAALSGLASLIPGIHVAIGVVLVTGHFPGAKQDAPPEFIGWIFIVLGALVILAGLTFSVCLALAGRFLHVHRHHTFCLVMASLACGFVPFGTILGVFTLITLMKPQARALFDAAPGRCPSSPLSSPSEADA